MMMLLNVAQTTILADSRLIQVEADKLNWVPQRRIAVSFASNYPAFDFDGRDLIDQLHWRFLASILHPFGSVLADERKFGGGLGYFATEASADGGGGQSRRSDHRSTQMRRHRSIRFPFSRPTLKLDWILAPLKNEGDTRERERERMT